MPVDQQVAAEPHEPFESLSQVRTEHLELMRAVRRNSGDGKLVPRIRAFIDRTQATGARIDSPADREAAQNIITYWASYLLNAADRDALSAPLPALNPFDPANAPDLSTAANPYQGCGPLGGPDAARFFGREEATKAVLDKLRDNPAVLVVGAMGSGKTSLIRAGVIPRLKSRMTIENKDPVFPVVIPGPDLFAALLRSIHEAAGDPALPTLDGWIDAHRRQLERASGYFCTLIETVFPDRPVILIVDQFENVFSLCSDASMREKFAEALLSICRDAQYPNRVIMVVDQLYERTTLALAALKPLADHAETRFWVPPLTAAEAIRIIEAGAAQIGLKFDEGIVEDLANKVARDPDALPALQFTLNLLWNERVRDRITWDAYRRVGGPRQALQRVAEAVYASLSRSEQAAAEQLFLQLVQQTAQGEFIRRSVRRDALPQVAPSAMAHALEQYVEAGLIQRTPGARWNDDHFELMQAQLIDSWARLNGWLKQRRQQSEKKLQLDATARLWQESGARPGYFLTGSGYLLTGDALEEAEAYADSSPEMKEFVIASRQYERRRAKIKNAVIAVLTVLAMLLAVTSSIAIYAGAKAVQESAAAERSEALALRAVRSTVQAVSKLSQTGGISAPAAQALLKTADDIFDVVELRPDLTATRADLLAQFSDVYLRIGDRPQALSHVERAKELEESLLASNPGSDDYKRLVYASAFRIADLQARDDPDGALRQLQRAVDLARQLAAENPASSQRQQNIAFVENKIGDIFLAKQDTRQALDHYQEALAISERLMAQQSGDPGRQKAVADARMRIGDLLASQGRSAEALAQYEPALTIREGLASKDQQSDDVYQSNLSTSYAHIGDFLAQQGQRDQALKRYEQAFDIQNRLALKDPDNAVWQSRLANIHVSIGDVLAKQDASGATAQYRTALAIRERLAAKQPTTIDRSVARAHEKLARLSVMQGQFDGALSEYGAALAIWKLLERSDPGSRDLQRGVATAYERIGDTWKAQAELRKSQDDLRSSIDAYQAGLAAVDDFLRGGPDSSLADTRARLQEKIHTKGSNSR